MATLTFDIILDFYAFKQPEKGYSLNIFIQIFIEL